MRCFLRFGDGRKGPIIPGRIWGSELAAPVVVAVGGDEEFLREEGNCDQESQQKRERFHAGLCYRTQRGMATSRWPWHPAEGMSCDDLLNVAPSRRLRHLGAGRHCAGGSGQRAEDAPGL